MSRGNSSELRQITSLSFSRLRPLILRSRVHMTNMHETWSQGCFHFVAEEATLQMKISFVFNMYTSLLTLRLLRVTKSCSVHMKCDRHKRTCDGEAAMIKLLNIRRFVCHFTGYVIYFKLETS